MLDEQLGHQFGFPSGGGVLDRVLDVSVGTAPSHRAASNRVSFLGPQLQPQKLAEQMVVAIPLPSGVRGNQEHI